MARKNTNGDVRFARVPSGSETCPFCIMLASRGFVYWSAELAGENSHYHPHCDCVIVPGWEGMHVEGYNPSKLYDKYVEMLRDGTLDYSKLTKGGGDTSHVLGWAAEGFECAGDFTAFIREARDIADLQARCAIVEREFPKSGLSSKYYDNVKTAVREMKSKLIVGDVSETDIITGRHSDINYALFDDFSAHGKNEFSMTYNMKTGKRVDACEGTEHGCSFSFPNDGHPSDYYTVHYHPSGGTLSEEDVCSMIDTGIGGMEARTDYGEESWVMKASEHSKGEDFKSAVNTFFAQAKKDILADAEREFGLDNVFESQAAVDYMTESLKRMAHEWYNKNAEKYGYMYEYFTKG